MKQLFLLFLLSCLFTLPGWAALKTQTVYYKDKGTTLEGYLVYDDSSEAKRPGVIVVHEWYGLNDHSKSSAEKLAQMGYVALAVDIFGKGVRPSGNEEAGRVAGIYKSNRQLMRQRVKAGFDYLLSQPNVDKNRIGAMGYCFGGTTVLELARSGAAVNAVISFHGDLNTSNTTEAKNIKGRILVLHGADDPYVPVDVVNTFQEEMRKANVDWQFVSYGGAVHSFTNPKAGNDNSKGAAYNEKADKRSWEAMKQFFADAFKI